MTNVSTGNASATKYPSYEKQIIPFSSMKRTLLEETTDFLFIVSVNAGIVPNSFYYEIEKLEKNNEDFDYCDCVSRVGDTCDSRKRNEDDKETLKWMEEIEKTIDKKGYEGLIHFIEVNNDFYKKIN